MKCKFLALILSLVFLTACNAPTQSPVTTSPPVPTPDKTADVVINGEKAITISQNTYFYKDANVTVINVKNQSDKPCDLVLNISYVDEVGNVIKTDSKSFEGFPQNYSNYFLFDPELSYHDAVCSAKANQCDKASDAEKLTIGKEVRIRALANMYVDDKGEVVFPTSAAHQATLKSRVVLDLGIGPSMVEGASEFELSGYIVIFDSDGNIDHISYTSSTIGNYSGGGIYSNALVATDVPGDEYYKYKLPEKYNNASGFFALESFKIIR